MARKNSEKSDHPGSIHFDSRTRTVMAGQDNHDNIKEKVQAVREVVPGKSNNEIVLVLQYYDYNVEKAIQAYVEDGAKEALGEWHVPVAKPNKKKKNKKKSSNMNEADTGASQPAGSATVTSSTTSSQSMQKASAASNGLSSSSSSSNNSKPLLPNGDLHHESESQLETPDPSMLGAAALGISTPSTSRMETVNGISPSPPSKAQNHPRTHSGSHGRGHGHHNHSHAQRTHTTSERSTASSVGAGGDNLSKRPFHGLEKSIKDLQRQTTSLERLRLLLDHEMERSHKSIKTVFEEMRMHVNAREKQLLAEMDVVKQQAYDVFKMRQEKAAMLKVQIERAEKMSESELVELRADVKHFVADRKVDEELGRTTRFHYDSDHLKEEILAFGEVLPVKCAYSVRRPSESSIASSGAGNDDAPVPAEHTNVALQPAPIQDGYQMTTEEVTSLQVKLLNSLKIQGYSHGSSPPHPSSETSNSASPEDDAGKMKNARRRNKNREWQEQRKSEEGAGTTPLPVFSSVSNADARPSLSQSSARSDPNSGPQPQRTHPHSPLGRGMGNRGRGGRGRGSGPSGYRSQGQNRGSPRRLYSGSRPGGSGGGGSGRGERGRGERGSGEPSRGSRPVLANGSVN